ncbi:MAG: cytochrome c [Novosphingobium sp.]
MIGKSLKGFSVALAVVALGAGPVLAAGAADVIRTRHDSYRELGAAFKNVNDELRTPKPQAMILQLSARQIRNVAQQQYGWFPAGSGPQSGVKTKALPAIWSNPGGFKAAQDAYAKQANAFYQTAASGDVAKVRIAAKALGATCAGCHKQFRGE